MMSSTRSVTPDTDETEDGKHTRQPLWVGICENAGKFSTLLFRSCTRVVQSTWAVWRRHGDHQGTGYCHAVPRSEPDRSGVSRRTGSMRWMLTVRAL